LKNGCGFLDNFAYEFSLPVSV